MPHLFAITGNLGAGKSTLGSILAWHIKLQVEAAGGWIKLFGNYDLAGAERLSVPEDWYRVADAHGSLCIWDEAHRSFDSRKHSKAANILATEILTFVRKMASIQIFITPSIMRLDTRIREITEILVVVRGNGKSGISCDFYDFQADYVGKFGRYLKTLYIPAFKVRQFHRLNLFDSHSFISGFPLPAHERDAMQFMDTLEKVHDKARKRIAGVSIA